MVAIKTDWQPFKPRWNYTVLLHSSRKYVLRKKEACTQRVVWHTTADQSGPALQTLQPITAAVEVKDWQSQWERQHKASRAFWKILQPSLFHLFQPSVKIRLKDFSYIFSGIRQGMLLSVNYLWWRTCYLVFKKFIMCNESYLFAVIIVWNAGKSIEPISARLCLKLVVSYCLERTVNLILMVLFVCCYVPQSQSSLWRSGAAGWQGRQVVSPSTILILSGFKDTNTKHSTKQPCFHGTNYKAGTQTLSLH